MRRALGISFATILVAAVACDEFSDGAPTTDAGTDDASSNVDASSTDDGGDGGGGGADGAADGGPSVPFCATVDAAFCWSFDDTSAGSALFGAKLMPKNANKPVALSKLALSPPNAMRAEGDGTSGPWMLTTTLPATSKVTCTMSVFIEQATNQTEVMTFALGSRNAAFLVEPLDDAAVTTSLLADRASQKKVALANLPKKKWLKIVLGGARMGDGGFTLGASAEGSQEVTAAFPDAGANIFADPLVLEVGYYVQYGGTGAVRVDDVFCTYE